MQLKTLALLPLASTLASAASWTAFVYSIEDCGVTARAPLLATIRGDSGAHYTMDDYTGAKARSVSFQWDTSNPPQDSGAMTIFTEDPETYNWHRVGTGYGNQCLTAIEDYPVDGFITIDCDQGDCPEPPAETPDGK